MLELPGERARVWVVDDSQLEAERACRLLGRLYDADTFVEGAALLERLSDGDLPDLILLDWQMPGVSGLEVCQFLRERYDEVTLPILMLTARGAKKDFTEGLSAGANDYVAKPYDDAELLARVKAVLRRFERPTTPAVITFEEIIIDANAMQLKVRGELTTTTATEFRLLDYLARHPGRVFSRDHLLDAVWGDARFVTPRSVDVYVRRIREKIEVDPENPRYLKTVRGAGYRFEIPKGE